MSAPSLTAYQNGVGQASGDSLNTMMQTCNYVSDLRAFVGITGIEVTIRGTSAINDGGQGAFYWNALGTGPDDNGVTNIVPSGSTAGCWTRVNNITGALAAVANDTILANISGGIASPIPNSLSGIIDATIGSTQGSMLIRGSGAWQALAAGASGTVLTSNGAGANPSWQASAVGAGAMTLLSTQTPSSVAALSELAIPGGYSHYVWEISNLTSSLNGVDAIMTVQQGGVFVGGTSYSSNTLVMANVANTQQETNAAQFTVSRPSGSYMSSTNPCLLVFEIWQPSLAATQAVLWKGVFYSSNTPYGVIGEGVVTGGMATTGIKLAMSSGNIAGAIAKLYGIS